MKVLLLCLDGLNPDLVYKWRDELPNFDEVMGEGAYGHIHSVHPPITPQAWTVVRSGQNPGRFGYWDFNYREDYSYFENVRVNSGKPLKHVETLDTILPKQGKKIGLLNVPVTYPPLEIPNGFCISSFMTPSEEYEFTYPSHLRILAKSVSKDEYYFDASTRDQNFRVMEKDRVLDRIYQMDEQKFKLLDHFVGQKEYDFIMTVIMGTDRMPHLFWHDMDPEHVRYEPDSKFKDALKNHYKFCDEWVGKIREKDEEMNLLLTSDHSVIGMDGRLNINEWFVENDYLKLKEKPEKQTSFKNLKIKWEDSIAWGSGYQGQVYLNVKGREEKGAVEQDDYDSTLNQVINDLEKIPDNNGKKLDTGIVKRKEVYNGPLAKFAPDLFTYFGKMHWAISPVVGHGSVYSYDTALGADDGIHGPQGFFMMAGPDTPNLGEIMPKPSPWSPPLKENSLLDIAPTVLHLMDIPIPSEMEGKVLIPS